MTADYPNRGEAWADYRHHRTRVIVEMVAEGNSYEAIACVLSMDPIQVRLIFVAANDRKAIRNAAKEAG